MVNQELIYRIAETIDGKFPQEDQAKVENLVIELYRAVEPFVQVAEKANQSKGSETRLVVSVFGLDHAGIVSDVTKILADAGCSIVDINQTVVNDKFAMVIIVNFARSNETVTTLKEKFKPIGEKLGVRVYIQREDLFNAMHRI